MHLVNKMTENATKKIQTNQQQMNLYDIMDIKDYDQICYIL